jgi:hypothetical protein
MKKELEEVLKHQGFSLDQVESDELKALSALSNEIIKVERVQPILLQLKDQHESGYINDIKYISESVYGAFEVLKSIEATLTVYQLISRRAGGKKQKKKKSKKGEILTFKF